MDLTEDVIIPIIVISFLAGGVCGVGSCIHKTIKENNQHNTIVLNNHQQDVGMKMSDFAEKYGPPRDVKDTEGIRFYTYYLEDVYLLITTKDGVVTKVSHP